jgi:hypothetical protein
MAEQSGELSPKTAADRLIWKDDCRLLSAALDLSPTCYLVWRQRVSPLLAPSMFAASFIQMRQLVQPSLHFLSRRGWQIACPAVCQKTISYRNHTISLSGE